MKWIAPLALSAIALIAAPVAQAQDVRITTFKTDSTFTLNGQTFRVARDQNTAATLPEEFALTSRACPPHCLQPMIVAEGVITLGELEVLDFLEDRVTGGTGLVLDTRLPADFEQMSIPGSVNVPATTLASENRFRDDILRALGAVDQAGDTLDFSNAMVLTIYSGGVWSDDAATAVSHLLSAGYPANRLHYYRGGMQAWVHAGLTVHPSQNPG